MTPKNSRKLWEWVAQLEEDPSPTSQYTLWLREGAAGGNNICIVATTQRTYVHKPRDTGTHWKWRWHVRWRVGSSLKSHGISANSLTEAIFTLLAGGIVDSINGG